MDLEDIEYEWKDYLEQIQQNKEILLKTPSSRLFKNKDAFDRAITVYQQ